MKTLFVTGTDTEVGKTYVSVAMLDLMRKRRLKTAALKPIAAGCEWVDAAWRNEDALQLQQAATESLPYEVVNPYAFKPPIAPHIAAEQSQCPIEFDVLDQSVTTASQTGADVVLVEGAGGWRLPLDGGRYFNDWVAHGQMDVVLVVGLRLGCLNHALLTAEAIQRQELTLAGWIANEVDTGMTYQDDNLATLKTRIDAPFLGHIPRLNDASEAFRYLDLTPLI